MGGADGDARTLAQQVKERIGVTDQRKIVKAALYGMQEVLLWCFVGLTS